MAAPDSRRWQVVIVEEHTTGVAVRLDTEAHRVDLGLAFLGGEKVVDVSTDPASWVGCARDGAWSMHQPRSRWADALTVGLRRAGVERGWWPDLPDELSPEATAAAAAWPLLRPAIDAGHDERLVPRWATHLCAAPDVRSGARAVLGPRADRRVVRELARALAGPVRWWPIACSTALAQLDAGRVGDLLSQSPSTHRCSQDERVLLARTLGSATPDTVRRLLTSADVPDGPQRLLAALDGWQRISSNYRFIPNRLDRLEALVEAELETPPPRPARPRPQRAQLQPRQAQPRHALPREAPVEAPPPEPPRREPQPERIEYADEWRPLHRARRGEIELALPATGEELVRWSRALNNCLNLYEVRARARRVIIVGIRNDGRLIGAAEINPTTRTVGQLEGPNNRPLPPQTERVVRGLLAQHGVSDV